MQRKICISKYLALFVFIGLFLLPYELINANPIDSVRVQNIFTLSLEELKSIKISSVTLHEEELESLPATIYITTHEEIENYAFKDLKDVLAYTSGVEYAYPHSWLQGGQRGIVGNFSKTKLLINGADINLLYTGEAFIGNQFTLENIERVEVIQGPGSVIYGADAFSGVINLVTRNVKEEPIYAELGGGTGFTHSGLEYYRAFGVVMGNLNKFNYAIDLGYTLLNDVDYSDFVRTNEFSRFNQRERDSLLQSGDHPYRDDNVANNVSVRVNYKPNSKHEINLEYYHFYDEDGGGQESPEVSFTPFKSIRRQELFNGKYTYKINPKNSLLVRAQYRYDDEMNDWIYRELVDGDVSPVYSWNVRGSTSAVLETYWNMDYSNINNFTIIGGGYRQENLAQIYFEEASFPELDKFLNPKNYHLLVQSQQKVFNWPLFLIVGLRKDFNSIYSAPFTTRSGLRFEATEKLTLKYFVSTAFRAPTLFELELNDELLPEYNTNQELSFQYEPLKDFLLGLSLYYTDAYDLIVNRIDQEAGAEDVFVSTNEGEQEYSGVEFVSKYLGKKLQTEFWLNYTHSENMIQVAPWKLGLKSCYYLNNHNSLSLLSKYTSSIKTDLITENAETEYTELPYFLNFDLTYQYRDLNIANKLKIDFRLSITNILNRANYYPNLRGNDPSRFKTQGRGIWVQMVFKI